MGETVRLKAPDRFELSAYVAKPAGTPRGGLVVAQEIFGVNGHIASSAMLAGAVAPMRSSRGAPGYAPLTMFRVLLQRRM